MHNMALVILTQDTANELLVFDKLSNHLSSRPGALDLMKKTRSEETPRARVIDN